ncbi:MAG TPA: alanine-tRNA synthetase second additional domain-containing protein [Candidatus Blautia merdavium]|uniref:Alanine-tRNA synthetase second additional domain-containing protein n=1 Tax=Candidatus Blautia merdavium TaxID=2838494 RepID=A0A9D2TC42_9FIRM|nr:alanine-tRNA synthetase second additional domain-containing protein [Candidatus Blautia merdavium]
MIYNNVRHECNLYNFFFAPRGNLRMMELGMKITQMYLNPFDRIIGIIGAQDSGKSMLIKGMFPGIQTVDEDDEFEILNMPLLNAEDVGFYTPRTFHVDVRAARKYVPLETIAQAVLDVTASKKRVIVEYFELLYPVLKRNADLLIGIGEEVLVTRPSLFGPLPDNIADIVFHSLIYRKMAHSAEDLFTYCVRDIERPEYSRADIKHGFVIQYKDKPSFDLEEIEGKIKDLIARDLPIVPYDEEHIKIGDEIIHCTGPLMHVESTGKIENFALVKEFYYEPRFNYYIVAGTVGHKEKEADDELNTIEIQEEV